MDTLLVWNQQCFQRQPAILSNKGLLEFRSLSESLLLTPSFLHASAAYVVRETARKSAYSLYPRVETRRLRRGNVPVGQYGLLEGDSTTTGSKTQITIRYALEVSEKNSSGRTKEMGKEASASVALGQPGTKKRIRESVRHHLESDVHSKRPCVQGLH